MKISHLINNKRVVTISGEKSLLELTKLLSDFKIGAVVVSENGMDIQGIVSERDLVKFIASGAEMGHAKVMDIMTRNVFVCNSDELAANVLHKMTESRFRHCPVVDENGKLSSIVSIGDLVKEQISEISKERDALNSYIHNYDFN